MPKFENVVLTIGSFDGVHGGHQKILERVSQLAQSIDSQSVVITFHPHPRLVVYPEDPSVKLLTTTEEKVELLKNYGVDVVLVMPFSREFSEQSPEEYVEKFLVHYFKPAYIVVGYDHRFGAKRAGDMYFLRQFEAKFGYQVVEIEKHIIDQIDVSSTKIRQSLEEGDVTNANRLLNHPFMFTGEVVHGQQIGRTIGFPTANLAVTDKINLSRRMAFTQFLSGLTA
ncbi:MAG: riboflavin biosynthesis protein RibF [Saprospiraceae bacterium]|nr:riboflavin biosynthesis protein RibF [Saprospiraceae bacterium]